MLRIPTLLTFLLLGTTGCAKFGYLTEQGYEQVKLQWSGVPNEKLLKDPSVPEEVKRKIRLVGEYKRYFYEYFDETPTSIYSKTAMLKGRAVTYLVVASPHTKIEAHEFSFPFMGNFPYIGFFNEASAQEFAKGLRERDNLVTWIRPVYAYSTLGYLEDRILSSFFEYDDLELAELIFHELFHTVFLAKNEVELNENLANFFAKRMMLEYFRDRPELARHLKKEEKKLLIARRMVELIGVLRTEFAKLGTFLTNERADELTAQFIEEVFKPDLVALCRSLKLEGDDCEVKQQWNQAGFAAFLTYEESQDFLHKLWAEENLSLKDYLDRLRMEYKHFRRQDDIHSFAEYLKKKVPDASLAADRSPGEAEH